MKFIIIFFVCVFFYFTTNHGQTTESSTETVTIRFPGETLEIGKCFPFEVISTLPRSSEGNFQFAFKTADGVKIFSDDQCKKMNSGIAQIKSEEKLTYYLQVNSEGEYTIAIHGLSRNKLKVRKVIGTSGLSELQSLSQKQQKNSVDTFHESRTLSDEAVLDFQNLEGEIRAIAYNNLRLQTNLEDQYYIGICSGPIEVTIPNLHRVIRGNQFARYIISHDKKAQYYADKDCKNIILYLKFDKNTSRNTIYLKGVEVGTSSIKLINRDKSFIQKVFFLTSQTISP